MPIAPMQCDLLHFQKISVCEEFRVSVSIEAYISRFIVGGIARLATVHQEDQSVRIRYCMYCV